MSHEKEDRAADELMAWLQQPRTQQLALELAKKRDKALTDVLRACRDSADAKVVRAVTFWDAASEAVTLFEKGKPSG